MKNDCFTPIFTQIPSGGATIDGQAHVPQNQTCQKPNRRVHWDVTFAMVEINGQMKRR